MKSLIVYYSFTHNNEKLAHHLREVINGDIAKIETVKKRTGLSIFLDILFNRKPAIKRVACDLRDYDHVIFLAPIWAGKIAMPLKTFLVNEKANIGNYSFVTLCGGGNTAQKASVQNQLQEITGKAPGKVVELWISNLVPTEKKGSVKNVTAYRIDPGEFRQFDQQIREALELTDLVTH